MPYRLLEEESPTFGEQALGAGKEIVRHGARTASNVATRTVGLPGDIFSLINEFIAKPTSKLITGEEGKPYEETLLGKALPTTETHRQGLEEKTGEFLKPKNKIEKFADDVIEDAALIINPSKLVSPVVKKGSHIFRSLAKSIGANFVGETAKEIGANETGAMATKAGALFLLSVMDQKSAAKQVSDLYRKAESKISPTTTTNASTLSSDINTLERSITKGRPIENLSPPEKFVVDQVNKVKNLISNGEISIEQAIAQKRSINRELATLYKEVPKLADQKNVKHLAKQLSGFLNKTIGQYGKKHPEFYKNYKNADQAYGTLAGSNFISRWIDNNVVQHPATTGLLHILGVPLGNVAVAGTGAIIPYQAIKLGYRISKSPTLAKIYGNTIKAAAKEDAKAFNKYLKQLDEGLEEEEAEDRYKFID